MSELDKELQEAVDDSEEASAVEAEPAVRDAPAPRKSTRAHWGLLAGLVLMAGAILVLVFTSFDNAAIYSKGVDELLAEKEKLSGRNVRVEGTLVKGSLKRRESPCEYRFKLEKNGKQLDVQYAQCVVPDTFRDMPGMNVSVTAEGQLAEGGHFDASHIMAKCPSKYEMKERAARGESAPHKGAQPTANN